MSVDPKKVSQSVLQMLNEATSSIGYDPALITTIPSGFDVFDIYVGGIPIGAPIVLVGNPGSGKSTLASSIIAKQEKMYSNFMSIYIDNEYSTSLERLQVMGINNVLLKAGLTLEQIETLLNEFASLKLKNQIEDPAIVVWDTYANTMAEKELEVDDPAKVTGWRVRLLSHKLPKMIATCINAKIAFVIINQLRDLISMDSYTTPAKELKHMRYGKDMPGGNPLKFNAFTLLDMKDAGLVPETYGFHGSIVELVTVKCKVRPSGTKFYLVMDHAKGFDNLFSKFEFLVRRKAIVSAGPARRLKNDPSQSFQVRNLRNKYNTDESFRKAFDELFESEKRIVLEELGKTIIASGSSESIKNEEQIQANGKGEAMLTSELENLTNIAKNN